MDTNAIVVILVMALVWISAISIAIYDFMVRQKKMDDIIRKCDKVNELCDDIIKTLEDNRKNGH